MLWFLMTFSHSTQFSKHKYLHLTKIMLVLVLCSNNYHDIQQFAWQHLFGLLKNACFDSGQNCLKYWLFWRFMFTFRHHWKQRSEYGRTFTYWLKIFSFYVSIQCFVDWIILWFWIYRIVSSVIVWFCWNLSIQAIKSLKILINQNSLLVVRQFCS